MSVDFFLVNRAHQVARLCTGESPKVDLLLPSARAKRPAKLSAFCQLLDRICEIGRSDCADLADDQRSDLLGFEREIVRLRFSADDAIKQPVVRLIKAIFADADYFSGLKPLPQYTDAFAYELLFPSWLNLLTATMLPRADGGKPRLLGPQQAALFQFLGKVRSENVDRESELVGILTFLARRFDAPVCEELLHRCAELWLKRGGRLLDSIDAIHTYSKSARQFARHVRDYLTVCHSMYKWPFPSQFPIAYRRPTLRVLPQGIVSRLNELDESRQDWELFFKFSSPLTRLINSDHLLATEFVQLLDTQPDLGGRLLAWVIEGDESRTQVLSAEAQAVLAELVTRETDAADDADVSRDQRLEVFARTMAPRLTGFDPSIVERFSKCFIRDTANRQKLLQACVSESERFALIQQTLEQARLSSDSAGLLTWLSCVTVLGPQPSFLVLPDDVSSSGEATKSAETGESEMPATGDESILAAKNSLLALDAVIQNRTIGSRELHDLEEDLRTHVNQAIGYLANPISTAGRKSPRLAALYMTLNEVAQTFAATGQVQNFSVVRAKYAALSRLTN